MSTGACGESRGRSQNDIGSWHRFGQPSRGACAERTWRRPERDCMMMKTLDRLFGALLLVGSLLHSFGSISYYPSGSQELVWALWARLAGRLFAVLNLVRPGRPEDRTIAWIAFVASLSWVAIAVGFGVAIGNLIDPRVLWHAISALVLAAF